MYGVTEKLEMQNYFIQSLFVTYTVTAKSQRLYVKLLRLTGRNRCYGIIAKLREITRDTKVIQYNVCLDLLHTIFLQREKSFRLFARNHCYCVTDILREINF